MGSHSERQIGRLGFAAAQLPVAALAPALLLDPLVRALGHSSEQFWWVPALNAVAGLIAAGAMGLADLVDPRRMLLWQQWLAVACMLMLCVAQHVAPKVGVWMFAGPAVVIGVVQTHGEMLAQRIGREDPEHEGRVGGRLRAMQGWLGHPSKLMLVIGASALGLDVVFGVLFFTCVLAAGVVGRDLNPQKPVTRIALRGFLAGVWGELRRDRSLRWAAVIAALTRASVYTWWGGVMVWLTLRGHTPRDAAIIGCMPVATAWLSGVWGRWLDRREGLAAALAPVILAAGWIVVGLAGLTSTLEAWKLVLPDGQPMTLFVPVAGVGFALLELGNQAESLIGARAIRDLERPEAAWRRSAGFRLVRDVGGVLAAFAGGGLAAIGDAARRTSASPGSYGSGERLMVSCGLAFAVIAGIARIVWLRRFRPTVELVRRARPVHRQAAPGAPRRPRDVARFTPSHRARPQSTGPSSDDGRVIDASRATAHRWRTVVTAACVVLVVLSTACTSGVADQHGVDLPKPRRDVHTFDLDKRRRPIGVPGTRRSWMGALAIRTAEGS